MSPSCGLERPRVCVGCGGRRRAPPSLSQPRAAIVPSCTVHAADPAISRLAPFFPSQAQLGEERKGGCSRSPTQWAAPAQIWPTPSVQRDPGNKWQRHTPLRPSLLPPWAFSECAGSGAGGGRSKGGASLQERLIQGSPIFFGFWGRIHPPSGGSCWQAYGGPYGVCVGLRTAVHLASVACKANALGQKRAPQGTPTPEHGAAGGRKAQFPALRPQRRWEGGGGRLGPRRLWQRDPSEGVHRRPRIRRHRRRAPRWPLPRGLRRRRSAAACHPPRFTRGAAAGQEDPPNLWPIPEAAAGKPRPPGPEIPAATAGAEGGAMFRAQGERARSKPESCLFLAPRPAERARGAGGDLPSPFNSSATRPPGAADAARLPPRAPAPRLPSHPPRGSRVVPP